MTSKEIPSQFFEEIGKRFPSDFLSRSPQDLEAYGRDWTRHYAPKPAAIAFPRSTEEVSRFLKLCTQFRVPMVPSGGRTGLAGGAVAAHGEVVLSLQRMNRMDPVDLRAHTVRVQAGAITQSVHEHCAHHGLTWPVDFASKGSSHVGGNISTNAGGVRVIRYGLTRSWVLGLQVVLMNGEILELNGALEKNNTGVDLRQLFIGSEGTLGVITEATLKLTRLARAPEVFFFALQDLPAVLELFKLARTGPFEVQAFECLSRNCLEAVVQSRKLRAPFEKEAPIYVLLEIERPEKEDVQSVLTEWLEGLFDRGLVLDGTWAQSPRDAREIWQLREGIAEALANRGLLHKNDVSVPVAELEGFIPDLEKLFHESFPDWEVFIFGHIGDGNLHINAIQPGGVDKKVFLDKCGIVDQSLFSLVQKYRGSVSAEHGIGLLKKSALSYSRTPAELAIFRGIKQVLDPLGLMNPGKIFDMD